MHFLENGNNIRRSKGAHWGRCAWRRKNVENFWSKTNQAGPQESTSTSRWLLQVFQTLLRSKKSTAEDSKLFIFIYISCKNQKVHTFLSPVFTLLVSVLLNAVMLFFFSHAQLGYGMYLYPYRATNILFLYLLISTSQYICGVSMRVCMDNFKGSG